VRSTEDVPIAIERLRQLGYVYQDDKGVSGREAFMWSPYAARHHLYVVIEGSKPHVDHIRFRDHLRKHPQVAREYAELKRVVADRYRNDRESYTEAKSEFISRVLADAT